MIKLDRNACTNFDAAASFEWLETNGIGGFAMGTVSGANTRRYHGLLTAATRPPLGRMTLLSKFEETLIIDGERHELSANRFPERVHPTGFRFLTEFRLDPFPIWIFEVHSIRIEKSVFMPNGFNAVACRWTFLNARTNQRSVQLELRPLLSFTDYHHLQHADNKFDGSFNSREDVVTVKPYPDQPELNFSHNAIAIEATGHWYQNFELTIEKERGFDFYEDLFQPFAMHFDLNTSPIADVAASADLELETNIDKLEKAESVRRNDLVRLAGGKTDLQKQLALAADQFLVARGNGQTVIAGYPWFSDWGRDTMIALPGLTLATGRSDIARNIILEFSKHISEGMIPNRFPDAGEIPDYNTVDATLWYFEAIRAYAETTGDHDLVQEVLYEQLADIIAWHVRGTRYNIHADTDGLLFAGSPDLQLTWMDAKIGNLVITPRTGKPVEIQALWYNALRIMADFATRFGHDQDLQRFDAMADLAKLSFNGLFWNEAEQCLFDVVENGHRDGSVRPNQIFSISLAHPVLNKEHWQAVVEKVEKELLTPVGLRSLSPNDPTYVPIYIGSPFDRDSGYHQGTVWGWLIGPFVDAYRKVNIDDETAIANLLAGFEQHLAEAGLGQFSEIFDGDAPHTPRGCPAQAWSVGELFRVMNE